MTQLDVLEEVLGRLHELGIAYAVTGSYASTYWGEPRSTHDIDLVVQISAEQAAALAEAVGPGYYADSESPPQCHPALHEGVPRPGQPRGTRLCAVHSADKLVNRAGVLHVQAG